MATYSSHVCCVSTHLGRPRLFSSLLALLMFAGILRIVCSFEDLLSAADEVEKDLSRPLPFAVPNSSIYLPTEEFLRRVRELTASCSVASVASVRGSEPPGDQEALEYVTLTKHSGYAAAHFLHARTRVLAVFGESARELITSHVALTLIEALCGIRNDSASRLLAERASSILDNTEIVLVPLANPSGRKMVDYGSRCEEHNANDVDLNRNWDYHWDQSLPQDRIPNANSSRISSKSPSASSSILVRDSSKVNSTMHWDMSLGNTTNENDLNVKTSSSRAGTYSDDRSYLARLQSGGHVERGKQLKRRRSRSGSGSAPFSEHETRALQIIATSLRPTAYITMQSGFAVGISGPTDCGTDSARLELDAARLAAISKRVASLHCPQCLYLPRFNLTGRVSCGSGADYAYEILRIPFVYTWRIFANAVANDGDCFRAFNPVSNRIFQKVTHRWSHALLTLAFAVHQWETVEHMHGASAALQNASRATEEVLASRANGTYASDDSSDELDTDSHDHVAGAFKRSATAPNSTSNDAEKGRKFKQELQRLFHLEFIDENNAIIDAEIIRTCLYAAFTLLGIALSLYAVRIAIFSRRLQRRRRTRYPDNKSQSSVTSFVDNMDKVL